LSPCTNSALQLSLPEGAQRPHPSAVLGLVWNFAFAIVI